MGYLIDESQPSRQVFFRPCPKVSTFMEVDTTTCKIFTE